VYVIGRKYNKFCPNKTHYDDFSTLGFLCAKKSVFLLVKIFMPIFAIVLNFYNKTQQEKYQIYSLFKHKNL